MKKLLLVAGLMASWNLAQAKDDDESIAKYDSVKEERFNLIYNESQPSIEHARKEAERRAKNDAWARCQRDITSNALEECV